MKKAYQIVTLCLAAALVGGVVAGCSNGVENPEATVTQTTDKSQMPEQGKGGVKAANGGGMMPKPMTAAPGEKTGIPK